MAASGAERRPRRGPAPIASFDHDHSDESSPENKLGARLPEIREAPACSAGDSLAPPEQRARSHSSPAVGAPAPRIDISRASSSSHHDSRDSSPELALFADAGADARAHLELGFREDGALELRSSTEELAFLEGAPGGPAPRAPPPARRASRRDSQGSEAALLGVSGRTSRLSSVGSQGSAHSALSGLSHASRLSAASGVSRSPSPHRMLLETSFCGPKPIETDPEVCAAAVERRLLAQAAQAAQAQPDARDRREVRTRVTLESARPASAPRLASPGAPPAPAPCCRSLDGDKRLKESRNRAAAERSRAPPEVLFPGNRAKHIIRIKLKPDHEYDSDGDGESERTLTSGEPAREPAAPPVAEGPARAPATLALAEGPRAPRPSRGSRTPSPGGAPVSRKSSFCSLFKSRETIASPDSPCEALRRKKSLNEGRSRSKSRDRSAAPTAAGKLRGSVLSLFKTPRKSAASPAPGSRDASPPPPAPARPRADALRYYEQAADGVIHIPLRTPPDEQPPDPAPRAAPARRTVLPDGSVIIPLHSPTDAAAGPSAPSAARCEPDPRVEQESERSNAASEPAPPAASPPAADTASESSPPEEAAPSQAADPPRGKERIIFTTHVGSEERVFSTQFSITKTPSVTSEISESIPSFPESEEVRPSETPRPGPSPPPDGRDSSGSEASSETAPRGGSEAERRGLVVQESFEELPYVPTTLPLERSLALPMVPVRERAGVLVAALQRPRAARASLASLPSPPGPARADASGGDAAGADAAGAERLRISLPRRARAASAAGPAPPPRAERARSRSGGDAGAARGRGAWVDFSEPERRKQPKRIQTLPAARDAVVFSYVPPERCRCECHAAAGSRAASPPAAGHAPPAAGHAPPFAADLELGHGLAEQDRPR